MTTVPRYSIVVPCFNEEAGLRELYRRVREAFDTTGEAWELVLVDDGSTDRTPELMRELRAADPRVAIIQFARNFGHQLAMTAGIDYARGEAVIIMDADLQDPPEVALEMIEKWKEGYQVVYGVRTEREGESAFKLLTAKWFYRIIFAITEVDIPLDTGDFRLMDRRVVNVLKSMREHHRFTRALVPWIGFRQTGVFYRRPARFAGETHYPLRKMLRFAMDGIFGFSYLPLRLATYLGTVLVGLGTLAGLVLLIARLAGSIPLAGQGLTFASVLLVGGAQLVCLGLLGEYIGRIYDEVRRRPLYTVREVLGLGESHLLSEKE